MSVLHTSATPAMQLFPCIFVHKIHIWLLLSHPINVFPCATHCTGRVKKKREQAGKSMHFPACSLNATRHYQSRYRAEIRACSQLFFGYIALMPTQRVHAHACTPELSSDNALEYVLPGIPTRQHMPTYFCHLASSSIRAWFGWVPFTMNSTRARIATTTPAMLAEL